MFPNSTSLRGCRPTDRGAMVRFVGRLLVTGFQAPVVEVADSNAVERVATPDDGRHLRRVLVR